MSKVLNYVLWTDHEWVDGLIITVEFLIYATPLQEHQKYFQFYYPEHQAAAEHSITHRYQIHFKDITVLPNLLHYTWRVMQAAIKISSHQNFNREEEATFSAMCRWSTYKSCREDATILIPKIPCQSKNRRNNCLKGTCLLAHKLTTTASCPAPSYTILLQSSLPSHSWCILS